ncbi:MAG: hypothetical protein M5R42_05510 [Rhodocyclaceae bacterium]|nr:hypothetical protein [Rhodocyclaceae bacterium]
MYFPELDAIAAVAPLRPRGAGLRSMRCPAPCRSSCSAMRPSSSSRAAPPSSHRNHRRLGLQSLPLRAAPAVRDHKTLTELFGQG